MIPVFAATFFLICASPAACLAADLNMHLAGIPSHPWFVEVTVGSVVGWMTGKIKGFSGVREWIEGYFPHPPGWLVFVLDLIVFAGVGGFLGTAIYNPESLISALAAGFAWPIGLGSLATRE